MALLSPNYFAQGMNAFDDQTQRLNQFAQSRASKEAGSAIAGGDYSGGSAVLNRAGMIDQAHNVLADKQVLDDRQTAQANLATDRAQKAKAIQIEGLSHLTQAIKQVQPGQRAAWLKAQLPNIQALGLPADQFSTLDETHLTDEALAPWESMLGKAKEDFTLSEGQKRFNGQGKVVAEGAPKPQEYLVLPEGGKAIPKPTNGDTVGNPAPAFAPTAAPGSAPTGASGQPRGVRNNNPLNVTSLPQGQWNGQTGADGQYAVFSTPEAGLAAADKNLQAYATQHGINTLSGIINRWAPGGKDGNDPAAYVATVAKDLGVDPNQPLDLADPKVRSIVLHSMAKVELGQPIPAAGSPPQPRQAAPATQVAGDPAGTLYGNPKEKPAPSGYEWTVGGSLQPIPGGPADPGGLGAAGAGGSVHGPDYLATLPPSQAQQVKAIAEGRMQFPSGFALKTPYWQQMLSAVSQYDPNFDAVNYNARAKTRADFTSGKNAQNIKALNTAIGHLGRLDSQIPGTSGLQDFPFATDVNSAVNFFARKSGDPGVTNFEQTASALATELTAVFRGSGGAEADVKRYLDQLNSNASDKQKKDAVKNIAELLRSRLEAVGSQYNQGMGTTEDPLTLLNADAAKTFGRLSGGGSSGGRTGAAPSSGGIPTVTPEQAAQLPKGTRFRTTDGRVLVRH